MAEPRAPDARAPALRRFLLVVAAATTAVFIWLTVRSVELAETWDALRESNAAWIFPSLALLALGVWLRAVRWWALFLPARRPPLASVTRSSLVGLFFNCILPLRAGEAARVVDLARRTQTSKTETAATVALERAADVLVLLLLLFALLPVLPEVTWVRAAAYFAVGLGGALVVAVGVLAVFGERALRLALWPLRWLPRMTGERWEQAPRNAVHGLAALRDPRIALVTLSLTALSWLVLAASFWALMPAFDLRLGFDAGLLVLITSSLALVIPAPPAGLGVFEAGVVVALVAYGVDASRALSYALVLHAVNLFPYLAAGGVLLARSRRRATIPS